MANAILKPDAAATADRGVKVPTAEPAPTGWTHPYYWAPFILIGNWR